MKNTLLILLLSILNSCNGQDKGAEGIVYFSRDKGMTWKNTSDGLPEKISIGLGGIAASTSMLGLATKEDGIFIFDFKANKWLSIPTDEQIIKSNPGGLIFFKNEIFVGTQFGGIFSSTNQGKNWTSKNSGLGNLTVRKFAEIDNTLYAGTNDGLYSYNEVLKKWKFEYGQSSLQVNGIAELDGTIYIATNKGIYTPAGNSKNWKQVFPGHSLHNISSSENTIYAMAYNELFSSADRGKSWQSIQSGLPKGLYTFNVTKNHTTVFAGQWDGVYRKDGPGEAWKYSGNGLPGGFAATNLKTYHGILIISCSERKLKQGMPAKE
ncbi:WD40/YVTN/BNR-like repeat-containing protein [Flavihumibacter fluvii]|uniref:WD40/YVTN/BNR-like repeat-containing protein n=1 Tax=Flavihumibacter fluvii TaxID=2838157 RepID=UPI001BDE2231|nr:hypothetical protein [Flavihumibacter fluvii]ULQ52675.1 hypothetical protein KJS93_21540 [Flavihumibacter fluvii]